MPTTIIPPFTPPIPRFTPANGQLVGPADGDALLAASVNNAFIQLADRTTLGFNGLYGVYGSRLRVEQLNSGPGVGGVITINPQQALRSSSGVLSGTFGGSFDINTTLGSATAINTWYYVYGFDNSGVLTPVIATDQPDTSIKYRSTSADQMFLTLFRTDGTNVCLNYFHQEGVYTYADEVSVLSGGAAVVPTAVPVDYIVPPFAQQAFVKFTVRNTSTTIKPVFSITRFSANGYSLTAGLSSDGTKETFGTYPLIIPLRPSAGVLSFTYEATAIDPGKASLDATVLGFFL